MTGRRLEASAGLFVLATGGIENARLLLASDATQRNGLGNDRDLVGRYFMEHPEGTVGVAMLTGRLDVADQFAPRDRRIFGVSLSPRIRAQEQLLNAIIELEFGETYRPESALGGTPLAIEDAVHRLDHLASRAPTQSTYSLCIARAEQAPNRASRVTLLGERDALGVRRSRVDWRVGEGDHLSLRRTMQRLARELGANRLGRGAVLLNDERPWQRLHEANHHMGTTRMGRSPETSVVDPDCRLHGVTNLFVAGSSVFPTVGAANPTLTLVALALRLGDRLRTEMTPR